MQENAGKIGQGRRRYENKQEKVGKQVGRNTSRNM
jgi:hypothetical protein